MYHAGGGLTGRGSSLRVDGLWKATNNAFSKSRFRLFVWSGFLLRNFGRVALFVRNDDHDKFILAVSAVFRSRDVGTPSVMLLIATVLDRMLRSKSLSHRGKLQKKLIDDACSE
jgi:hypothetical protein